MDNGRPDLGKIGMVKINVFYTRMNGKWNEIKKKTSNYEIQNINWSLIDPQYPHLHHSGSDAYSY